MATARRRLRRTDARPRRARGLVAIVATALAAGAGCRAEQGTPWTCTCTYLTDYDDASRHEVEVCAPGRDRAESQARGCAQSGAPAPIQGCTCAPAGGARCDVGVCRAR